VTRPAPRSDAPSSPEAEGLLRLDLDDSRWDGLRARDPDATPFHLPAWAAFLAECYGFRPFVAAVARSDGELAAAVPVLETRLPLVGRRHWIALPFTDVCPPLSTEDDGLVALVGQLAAAGQRDGIRRIEIRAAVPAPQAHVTTEAVQHVLELEDDPEALRRAFHPSVRQGIRRAERAGLVVRRGDRREDLTRVFYDLHVSTRRRLGVPVQRRRFFELLWDRVLAPGGGYVLVAELQGEPIAAAVFLVDERTTIYKYGASDQRHLKTRPNHALFWEAITDACARGHRRFDFGRSDFDGEGLRRFKSSWGAQELELDYTTIGPAPAPHEGGGGRLSALAASVIRRSPSLVCRGAGLFYRFSA
jgi:CelD/BcsL family acetyltransferase involved in cellulose biosynthesis